MALKFLNDGYFAGKVGIGTESPDRKLHVKDSAIVVSEFEGTNTGSLLDLVNSNASQLYNGIRFTQGASSKMAITHIADGTTKGYVQIGNSWATGSEILVVDGRTSSVGIGTTSPIELLHLYGGVGNPTRIRLQADDGQDDVLTFHQSTTQKGAVGYDDSDDVVSLTYGGLSGTTGIKINSSGNVGIGTTSPGAKLDIDNGAVTDVRIRGNQTSDARIGAYNFYNTAASDVVAAISADRDGANDAAALAFDTQIAGGGMTERMRIDSAGNVGIGTASPTAKLQVSGASFFTSDLFTLQNKGIFFNGISDFSSGIAGIDSGTSVRIFAGGSEKVRVKSTGNVGIGTTSPSEKLHIAGGGSGNIRLDSGGTYYGTNVQAISSAGLKIGNDDFSGYAYFHNDGNVGIGTTSPSVALQLGNSTLGQTKLAIFNSEGGGEVGLTIKSRTNRASLLVSDNDTGVYISAEGGKGSFGRTQGVSTANINIDGSGNVGIGTTSPTAKLHVVGTGLFTGLVSGITPVAAANFVTKAYVDGSGGGTGPFLPLAGGILTGNVRLNDNVQLQIGSSNDAYITHNGTNTYFVNGVGNLEITNDTNDGDIIFKCDNGSGGTIAYLTLDGSNERLQVDAPNGMLFPDNIKAKFGTSADLQIYHNGTTGNNNIDNISGDLYISQYANDKDIIFRSDDGSGGVAEYFRLDGSVAGSPYVYTKFPDYSVASFGNGNDLQIYHDASNSYISDSGAGDLYLLASDNVYFQTYGSGKRWITLTENAGVDLFYNDVHKLSTGILGVGTATTTGGTLIDGWITTTQANAINNTTIATTAYVNNKIALIPAGLVFQGTWNAATNTPTLTSGSGTTGNFYIVSVAGSTNLDGITDWKVGDWAVFIEQGASDQWEKIDNSSVLDGFGTGGSVAGWAGSGTSNTLTNAPITFSGNNTTFAGSITATNFITTTDTGININGITLTRVAVNSAIRVSQGLETLGLLRSYAGLNIAQTSTFGGNITANGYLTLTGQATPQIFMQSNTAGTPNWTMIARTDGYFLLGRSGVSNDFYFDPSGNATFAGDVNITQTTDVGVLNTTNLDNGSAVGLSLTYPTSNVAAGDGLAIAIGIAGRGRSYIANSNLTTNLDASNLAFYTESGGVIGKRMIINQDGNVGIGASSPLELLHLESTEPLIRFDDTNSGIHYIIGQDGDGFKFTTNNSTYGKYTFDSNVGIGTTGPLSMLTVGSSVGQSRAAIYGEAYGSQGVFDQGIRGEGTAYGVLGISTGTGVGVYGQSSTGVAGYFTSSSGYGLLVVNGNVGIGNTGPLAKLQVGFSTSNSSNRSTLAMFGASESGILNALSLVNTNGAAATGYGTRINFHLSSNYSPTGCIEVVTENLASNATDSTMRFSTYGTIGSSTTYQSRLEISSAGAIKFNDYNSTKQTGTPTYLLGTDASGNVVKTLTTPSPVTSQAASLYDLIPNGAFTITYAFTSTAGTYAKVMQGDDVITANGTYTVQMFVNDFAVGGTQYDETYSGIMSWGSSTSTNDTGDGAISEIVLHRSGHAANTGMTYLRTRETTSSEGNELRLEIMCNRTYTGASNVVFKFVRLI